MGLTARATPAAGPDRRDIAPDLTDDDRAVLARVDGARADGVALLRWWQQREATGGYADKFELIRTFNRPDESFAFFDRAPVRGGPIPVMGMVEDMLYDQPKHAPPEKVREELREFVLHYLLRISAFETPEAYTPADPAVRPRVFPALSLCPAPETRKSGFGYSQMYFKRKDSGRVGKFPPDQRSRIVDLRRIGTEFEWVVVKVRIHDFNLTYRPRGAESLQFVLPLREESYLVISPEFVANEDNPGPELLGRYGVGYAFVEDPVNPGPFAYGPGQFRASFQLIHFRILRSGEIHADLVFVANRPDRILQIDFAPLDWGLGLAEVLSLGLAGPLLAPLRRVASSWPLRLGTFDPVGAFVQLANLTTGGAAARDYCISHEQLERQFLVQHFVQHYQMVTGSLLTWRQYADWLDRAGLPEDVIRGVTT